MIKKILLTAAIVLTGCKTVSCEDYVKDQIIQRQAAGLVPLDRMGDSSVIIFAWLNSATLEADGLVFLFPTHPDYKKADLGVPNASELGMCMEGGEEIRIVGFKAPLPKASEVQARN